MFESLMQDGTNVWDRFFANTVQQNVMNNIQHIIIARFYFYLGFYLKAIQTWRFAWQTWLKFNINDKRNAKIIGQSLASWRFNVSLKSYQTVVNIVFFRSFCAYHIRVIKVSGTRYKTEVTRVVAIEFDNTSDTVPWVLDVRIVSPDVTICGYLFVIRLK